MRPMRTMSMHQRTIMVWIVDGSFVCSIFEIFCSTLFSFAWPTTWVTAATFPSK